MLLRSQPAPVRSVDVQVDMVCLELLDGIRDSLPVGLGGIGADLHVLASDHVANRIGLQNDAELEVIRLQNLLGKGADILVHVALKATVG